MPETPAERVVFMLGVVAIVALAALVALTWRHNHRTHATPPAHTTAVAPRETAAAAVAATMPASTAAATTPAAPGVRLVLRATRATWVSVRRGSAHGPVLFTGILATGASRSFSGRALWARFGAAANVQASVDGKKLSLPGGTYSALITSGELRKVA